MLATTSTQASVRPFDQGAASAKAQDGLPNPYETGSIEHGNYELGRAYAIRANPTLAMPPVAQTAAPMHRTAASARRR